MDLIELIFALIDAVTPINDADRQSLYSDAQKWKKSIEVDTAKPIEKMYMNINKAWYVRLALTASFPFIVRWLDNYMKGTNILKEED